MMDILAQPLLYIDLVYHVSCLLTVTKYESSPYHVQQLTKFTSCRNLRLPRFSLTALFGTGMCSIRQLCLLPLAMTNCSSLLVNYLILILGLALRHSVTYGHNVIRPPTAWPVNLLTA